MGSSRVYARGGALLGKPLVTRYTGYKLQLAATFLVARAAATRENFQKFFEMYTQSWATPRATTQLMSGSPIKRARIDAALALIAGDPAAVIEDICSSISAGGVTLDRWCLDQEPRVHYGTIGKWIDSDPERKRRYLEASGLREARDKDWVIRELQGWVDCDIMDAFNEDGTMKALKDIPAEVRRSIVGFEVHELWGMDLEGNRTVVGCVKKIKIADKTKAIEMMARHLKMLVDRVEHDGKVTLEDILTQSHEK
jgi:hypothetical protein